MANLSNINNILRISSSGVGLNKDNTGPSELDIESAGADMIDMTRTGLKTYRFAISGSSDFSIFDVAANADRLIIDSSGNLLLNQATSRIKGGGSTTGRLEVANSDSKSYMMVTGSTRPSDPNLIYFVNDAAVTLTLNENNSATFAGNVILGDTPQVQLGTGNDAQIYHNGGHLFIDNSTGNSYLRNTSTGDILLRNSTGGDIQFDNEFAGNILFNTSNIERMRIDSSGNTTFAGMITVNGDGIDIDNDDNLRFRFYNSVFKAGLQVATSTGDMIEGSATNDFAIRSQSNMLFATGGATERMRIDSSGNVGIGVSPSTSRLKVSGANTSGTPLVDLVASGTGTFQRGVRLLNGGMVAGNHIMYAVGRSDNSRNMGQTYFYYAGDGSTSNRISMGLHSVDDVFNIAGTGNVGIGTTSPTARLDVSQSSGSTLIRLSNADGSLVDAGDIQARLLFAGRYYSGSGTQNVTSEIRQIKNNGDGYGGGAEMAFLTNDSEKMRILASGGITFNGNTSTDSALDDYEEGEFYTNVLGTNVSNYSASGNNGRYTKIGRQVIVTFHYSVSAGTGQKYMVVSNLPFVQHTASHDEQGYCSNYPVGQRRSGIVVNNSSGESNSWYVSWYNNSAQSNNGLRATIIYTTT